jgi:hypothetical protein
MRAKDNRIKVRFHLGAGEHYQHWKIEYPDGVVKFINPNDINFTMIGCQLHNRKGTAKSIHVGGEKVVCAWVWCEAIHFGNIPDNKFNGLPIRYNPRVEPNWVDVLGQNVDNQKYGVIQSYGKNLFVYFV